MANISRNFIAGKMNKVVDERLVPNGEYIDALNIRMGSTENSEMGTIENAKGNLVLTSLAYPIDGTPLSDQATTIGAFEDGANETLYWFVHDPAFTVGATGKLDLIVSFNTLTNILTYHVTSVDDGDGVNTTLNFNPKYLITGVNKIGNLLFWTDDYNAPRKINVRKSYALPIGNLDDPLLWKSILVIKQPPVSSPEVEPILVAGQENFMETRFICFAYRYRYADNEYSATSQFSEPSFVPGPFNFDLSTYLNSGMQNITNAATITYNSGDDLVVGIDLLFKEPDSNIIKVIEKLDKNELGLADNTNYQYTFSNSKIFTVLPEYEIFRLYDNVPRYAKAQTIMGNRLMYGNYVDGYNLIDKYGSPVKFEYYTSLVSEEINNSNLTTSVTDGNYNIYNPINIFNSIAEFDLSGVDLNSGGIIQISITLEHSDFDGNTTYPTITTNSTTVDFIFNLNNSYANAYELATSAEFQNAIGTIANIKPVYSSNPLQETSCDGTTFTDVLNCALPSSLGSLTKYTSGISADGQAIEIISSPSSSIIGLQLIAMKYVTDVNSPTDFVYEYYKVTSMEVTYQNVGSAPSLHSNRGYEVGIVYMDEFNRSTTALVSNDNTEFVPCGYAANQNKIQVTIPTAQVAPSWAKKYKFVIKPDRENYETIYSNLFFIDPQTNYAWFLLEGENAIKVEVGDKLIVKSDSNGATNECKFTTILDKQAQPEDFLTIPSVTPGLNIPIPAGVYIKVKPNDFSAFFDEQSVIAPGLKDDIADQNLVGDYPWVAYPMNIEDPANPGFYIDYDIPNGSVMTLDINFKIEGGGNCDAREYSIKKSIIASDTYANMYDFWMNQNLDAVLNSGDGSTTSSCPIDNVLNTPLLATTPSMIPTGVGCLTQAYYYQFFRDPASNKLSIVVQGAPKCGNGYGKKKSSVSVNIELFRTENIFVFETEPSEALPDIFYENNLSFDINALGEHQGNIMNQNFGTGQPAVVDTGFYNCFSFGNGVESYKMFDSLTGNPFNFGNRVTSVAAQDYKEADRFADITYSGVYNNETNVNKLNEFNLGLLNFKKLEQSFGPIYIMDARQTDVLVLQEDKISFVLASKNLLSDAAAGGALTSVPEVLGTQIARTEKYGISMNPESYVQWGYDRFFTDAKRGVVIQLKTADIKTAYTGNDAQLNVISDTGMRTWFRDLFNTDFNTQKLGGYDPYLNEYVLSSNNRLLPDTQDCLDCGISQVFTFTEAERQFNYCVNVGQNVGDVVVTYNVVSLPFGNNFEIESTFNGVTQTTGEVTTSGSFIIDKDSNSQDIVELNIYTNGVAIIEINVSCVVPNILTIVEVVLTNNSEGGQTTRVEYRYTDGAFVGSLQSNLVMFNFGASNPLVSRYNAVSGPQGSSSIPTNGSTMRMANNQFGFATFTFDPATDRFRYLRTNTLYNNTSAELYALLAACNTATPINGGGTYYYADFNVGASGDYLYLIWDYRTAVPTELCFDTTSVTDVCCNCQTCEDECSFWSAANIGDGNAEVQYQSCTDGELVTITIPENEVANICGKTDYIPQVVSGNVRIQTEQQCGCPS